MPRDGLLIVILVLILCMSCSSANTASSIRRREDIMNSPNWRDGKFWNKLERRDSSMWTMLKAQMKNDAKHREPKTEFPVVIRKRADFSPEPDSSLRVTWFGHSSVLIEIDGYKVLTDPVWSNRTSPVSFAGPKRFFSPPLPIEELPAVDVVVISHDHFDHLDKKTIKSIAARVKLFVVPLGVGELLEKWGVEISKIRECDWWDEVIYDGLTFTSTPARHFSGRSLTLYNNKTLWCGWSIAGTKHKVYVSGDTGMFPGFAEIGEKLGPYDITLLEIGAYSKLWRDVHMGPEQAVKAHKMVKGKVMIPVHWATFNLAFHNWTEPAERVIEAARDENISLFIPKPGEIVNFDNINSFNKWWPDIPWDTAEDAPVISSGL